MTRLATALIFSAALTLTGCSGSDTGGESEAASKPAKSRCLAVNQATTKAISEFLNADNKLGKSVAVKSRDFKKVYIVAAKIEGGADDNVGLWSTNDDPTDATFEGAVQSVSGFSKEFSTWPDGTKNVPAGSDGLDEAESCLK